VVTGAVVRPGSTRVIPVVPELIRNGDGEEKQDYEWNTGKRQLLKYGKEYAWLSPTLSGDDLYANQPFCGAVLKEKLHFIFTRKPGSYPVTITLNRRRIKKFLSANFTDL
jgi:hypothetical protein